MRKQEDKNKSLIFFFLKKKSILPAPTPLLKIKKNEMDLEWAFVLSTWMDVREQEWIGGPCDGNKDGHVRKLWPGWRGVTRIKRESPLATRH